MVSVWSVLPNAVVVIGFVSISIIGLCVYIEINGNRFVACVIGSSIYLYIIAAAISEAVTERIIDKLKVEICALFNREGMAGAIIG